MALVEVTVLFSEFTRDRLRYLRMASATLRVLVLHDATGELSAAFGGSLALPENDEGIVPKKVDAPT
jgi:hypothetical protein